MTFGSRHGDVTEAVDCKKEIKSRISASVPIWVIERSQSKPRSRFQHSHATDLVLGESTPDFRPSDRSIEEVRFEIGSHIDIVPFQTFGLMNSSHDDSCYLLILTEATFEAIYAVELERIRDEKD